MENMIKICDDEEICVFIGLARRLWFRRNEVVHGGVFTHPNALVQQTLKFKVEYSKAIAQPIGPSWPAVIQRWIAPIQGAWRLNWDAAVCTRHGIAGMGVVVRNFNGGVEDVRCMVNEGLSDPLVAKAWAGGQALKFGRELHLNNIILEGDTKIVMDAINSGETNKSKIGIIVEDMKLMMLRFPQCTVCAVRRAANSIAHVIAQMAIRENVERTWRSYYPECILQVVTRESVSPSFD